MKAETLDKIVRYGLCVRYIPETRTETYADATAKNKREGFTLLRIRGKDFFPDAPDNAKKWDEKNPLGFIWHRREVKNSFGGQWAVVRVAESGSNVLFSKDNIGPDLDKLVDELCESIDKVNAVRASYEVITEADIEPDHRYWGNNL